MRFETKAIHISQEPDPTTGAVIIPIHLSTTFYQEYPGRHKGYEYSRTQNPTREVLEEVIASLEDGRYGLAFSSGCAATMAVVGSILSPGDEIVSSSDIYGGTHRIFEKILRPLSINTVYAFSQDPEEFINLISERTKLIWLETPSNPLLKLYDINAIATKKRGDILLVVDNTFATPYFQKPLRNGADIVVHSSTKYINGHSDIVGGLVVTNNETVYKKIKFYQNAAGAVPSPFDSFLTLRGIKTLPVRMDRHFENVKQVYGYLMDCRYVKNVYFPDLKTDIFKKQMSGFCGMISFELDMEPDIINHFIKSLRLIKNAESLGGIESLICLPARMTHSSMDIEERKKRGISDRLIRLSVGIENYIDIIEDIDNAFKFVANSRLDYEI